MTRNQLSLTFVALFSFAAFGSELKPFVSDGCSRFPDGLISQQDLWLHCCIEHDFAYWKGGTSKERLHSDQELRQCVGETGHPLIGMLMFGGVRLGGSPLWPTPFRWGFGWDYPRIYGPLSPEELELAESQTRKLEHDADGINSINTTEIAH
ncbi:hypothetical protein [Endozoicomonas sp.]|uniref:hypothetical protein n=1 Tax=Endozoicomonas sp. TaxID=1892382 RepID=UPI002886814F|nr:hypothetical protein [Endozoicomonas sp.]